MQGAKDFQKLVEESQRILITAHLGSDGDSISSGLLLYETLKLNYPDKDIRINYEEITPGLEFIHNFDKIGTDRLFEALKSQHTDLLVILDANGVRRCTRKPAEAQSQISGNSTKLAIVDHHEPDDKDESDVYINQDSPAVVQDIYEICFEELGLKKPEGYAQTAMVGLYTDTGGFVYDNPRYKKTLALVAQLIDDGANLEKIVFAVNRYSKESLQTIDELTRNLKEGADFIYSYVSDEFAGKWANGSEPAALKQGTDFFVNSFLRNIDDKYWGFILYPDLLAETKTYKLSLRAATGSRNVAKIALALGGGGHVQSAGAQIEADSVEDALKIVLDIVK